MKLAFNQTIKLFNTIRHTQILKIKQNTKPNMFQSCPFDNNFNMSDVLKKNINIVYEDFKILKNKNPEQAQDFVDAINIARGKYSYLFSETANLNKAIKSETGLSMNNYFEKVKDFAFLAKNHSMLSKTKGFNECLKYNLQLLSDAKSMQKYEGIINFINKYPKSEFSNVLYHEYLIDRFKNVNNEKANKYIRQLKQINRDYNVKVFLPGIANEQELANAISQIEHELFLHDFKSGCKYPFPPSININIASSEGFYNGSASGVHFVKSGAIGFPGFSNLKISLRHELNHRGQKRHYSGTAGSLENIIAYQKDKKGNYILDEKGQKILDLKKCQFYNDLKKGGIKETKIQYAYTNKNEMIAVAGTGDMSKYSPEFVEYLLNIGMGEYCTKLPNSNLINYIQARI